VTTKEVEEGMTAGGDRGERATGTPNTIYDLSSVLLHSLEGGASYDQYIHDAEEAGDQQLADFFRRVRDEDSMRADEAQLLLAERTPSGSQTGGGTAAEGVATGVPPATGPAGTAPAVEEQPPRGRGEEGLPPRTEERPLGSEGVMPPRPEEAPRRTEEAPLPEEHERARQPEREREDRGLIDRALDKLVGEEDHRREGPDRPGQR
jgi:hypothetical protein